MDLKLYRYATTKLGTFGVLVVGSQTYKTVERPYLDNKPFVSCVPPGKYTLENHSSRKFGETYALVNHELGVYHYDAPNAKRTAILIHSANFPRQLHGCIGLGKGLGFIQDQLAVVNSRQATGEVLRRLSIIDQHTIEIIDKETRHAEPT